MIGSIGFAVLAAISFGAKPPGYLPRIGPAPLRFQPPAKPLEQTVALPPLVMCDPPPEKHEVMVNDATPVEAPVQPTPPPVVVGPAPARVQADFTPQMFLPFFTNHGTNQAPQVVVPFEFIPPAASPTIPAPPSKATYTKK
ncbi:MAG: hypothetical protein ACXWIU_07875 [Limisphaerales bacterium]